MTAAMPERSRQPAPAAVLLALAAVAWALTADRMDGMDAGPGSALGGVGWFAVTWLLMMAAMMLPAITPMVLAYGRRASSGDATAALVVGYLVTWLAAGLVAYLVVEGVRTRAPGFLAWEQGGRYVAAAVIAAAGLYQLTQPKRACLRRCRDSRGVLRELPRPGLEGAVRAGLRFGAVCVGCSWALMAALLALGAMSLTWMALVAALVTAERLLPWSDAARRTVAAALIALAIGVALAPGHVPGLTLPGQEMRMG